LARVSECRSELSEEFRKNFRADEITPRHQKRPESWGLLRLSCISPVLHLSCISPSLYAPMDAALKRLTDAGFSSYTATVILSTIYSYVIGFVIEEQAVVRKDGSIADPYLLENRSRRIDPKQTPLALEAGKYLFTDFNRRFNSGLKLIVNGIESANTKRL
jgi:hypothetical protein